MPLLPRHTPHPRPCLVQSRQLVILSNGDSTSELQATHLELQMPGNYLFPDSQSPDLSLKLNLVEGTIFF